MSYLVRSFAWITIMVFAAQAAGHGVPIDVLLNDENRLVIQEGFEAGDLERVADTVLTTELPGIGVLSPENGVPDGTPLSLEVLHGLYYWNGTDVVPTDAMLVIDSPVIDGFGQVNVSPVPQYEVTAETGPLAGMLWGTYDATPPGWDSHGSYTLLPLTADAGVYGTVVRLTAPGHQPTDPFILPLSYDPLGRRSEEEIEMGVDAIAEAAMPPGDTDGDGDVDFDDIGPFVVSLNDPVAYQSSLQVSEAVRVKRGDLDGDGDVDFDDIGPLVVQLGGQAAIARAVGHGVSAPEPSTWALAILALWLAAAPPRVHR